MERSMKGVLFDLEGTLVQSGYEKDPSLLTSLHDETYDFLLDFGIPKEIISETKKSVYMRNNSYKWLINNKPEEKNIFRNKLNVFLEKYDLISVNNSDVYDDTICILDYLYNKNYKIGIVTNTSKTAAEQILSKCGIKKYFNVVITRDDSLKIKPSPAQIKIAIKLMNSEIQYFIGDSKVDMIAAKKTEIKFILIKRTKELINYAPDITITKLTELTKYL